HNCTLLSFRKPSGARLSGIHNHETTIFAPPVVMDSGLAPSARPGMTASVHLLDEHPDRAAARQADLPRSFVGDAEFQRLRLAALDHVERLSDDRALDAAA